jgi:hypothetical protein
MKIEPSIFCFGFSAALGNHDCLAILSKAYRSAAARGVIVVVFVAFGKEAVS